MIAVSLSGSKAVAGYCPQDPERSALRSNRRAVLGAACLGAGSVAWPAWAAQDRIAPPGLNGPSVPRAVAARHAQAFEGLAQRLTTQAPDVQSLAVVHRGTLAFEFYRAGLTADTLQDTQSVTKSVLALLFGCAMADGLVRGPQELVAMHLPEMLRLGADARLQRLRLGHLLAMTAGWPGEETARRDRDDDLRWLVRRPFVAEPGERFAYDNGAANLLALALARAAGQPLAAYARQRLLAPLGIERFDWRQGAQGHALGALGLSLSTRAMARLGELVLAEGRWQGRALLPADYLRQATEPRSAGGAPLWAPYGYLWWVSAEAPKPRGARRTAMASGYGGQWIYLHPPLDLVVAATSRRTPESMQRAQALAAIRRDIMPAVQRWLVN